MTAGWGKGEGEGGGSVIPDTVFAPGAAIFTYVHRTKTPLIATVRA